MMRYKYLSDIAQYHIGKKSVKYLSTAIFTVLLSFWMCNDRNISI